MTKKFVLAFKVFCLLAAVHTRICGSTIDGGQGDLRGAGEKDSLVLELSDTLSYCDSYDCIYMTSLHSDETDELVLAMLSYDFSVDPYPPLYTGLIKYLFDLSPSYRTRLLLLNIGSMKGDVSIIPLLPRRVIVVQIYHAALQWDLQKLSEYRKFAGLPKAGLLVLNHEKPWVGVRSQLSTITEAQSLPLSSPRDDSGYIPNSALSHIYRNHFSLVFRNYYFEPLSGCSIALPLGPKRFGEVIGNPKAIQSLALASARGIRCRFIGRFIYEDPSIHQQERYDLRDLILRLYSTSSSSSTDPTPPCEVIEEEHTYGEYLLSLANTVFVPCPAGNNPETFRHYEAMALGAIPLVIRPKRPYDYIGALWQGYPGPLFDSWPQAISFVQEISQNSTAVDELQKSVYNWYEKLMSGTKAVILDAVRMTFYHESSHNSTDSYSGSGRNGCSCEFNNGDKEATLKQMASEIRQLRERLTLIEGEI